MKPRIFLGSSAESLGTLQKVADLLSVIGDCKMWTNAFEQNKSNLESLARETKLSDFSVLLAMKDDILLKKGELRDVARDNVIFEFALFLGSTGLNRAFLLAQEGIDLPTDLDGITVSKFTLEAGKHNSLDKVCETIIAAIKKVSQGSDLGFLPSTALAIGYYYNFIKRVCEDLHANAKIVIGDRENAKEIKVKDFKFHVIIPYNLDDNGVDDFKTFYHRKQSLNSATTGTLETKRGYPFVFKFEPPDQNEKDDKIIDLFDVPSTLNTIGEALKLYMPRVQVGESEEVEHLESRELSNFAKVLRYLISKNTSTRNNVIVQENVRLD
jgi:hypothetical protein